ncbi:MAG TPA: hypothetical protein VN176_20015 [Verrucomicrobiae bacterium]|jgi:hypothetical protein|nr:hypothetical protein [Verrucomicrobiae bacterium]
MKLPARLFTGISFLAFLLLFAAVSALGQQLDGAFSVSTFQSTSAASAGTQYSPQSIGGGAFIGASADFLLWHHLGIGGEVNWRARRNVYQAVQPFRPVFYDFNAVWAPPLGKRASAELQGGFGGTNTRFYQPFLSCNFFSCTDFSSVNHLDGHLGGGLRVYIWHNVFLRPEAHFYFIRHNYEFSGPAATRLGMSLGYSFRGAP